MKKGRTKRGIRNPELVGAGKVTKLLKDANNKVKWADSYKGTRRSIKPENFKKQKTTTPVKIPNRVKPSMKMQLRSSTAISRVNMAKTTSKPRIKGLSKLRANLQKSSPSRGMAKKAPTRRPPSRGQGWSVLKKANTFFFEKPKS